MANQTFGFDAICIKSWFLFRASLRQTYWYGFFAALLGQLLLTTINQSTNFTSEALQGTISGKGLSMLFLTALCFAVVLIITEALVMTAQHQTLHGKPLKTKEVFQHTGPLLTQLVVAGLIVKALVLIGMFLYLVPALIVMAFLFTYLPAMLFERRSVFDAMKLSFERVRPRFFLVLALVVLGLLVTNLPTFVLLLLDMIGPQTAGHMMFGLDEVIKILLQALTIPLVTALVLTTYMHLKTQAVTS